MNDRYRNLLSPVVVGGVLMKNRMMATAGFPRALMGSGQVINENVITHFSQRAANGAAAVYFNGEALPDPPGPHPNEDNNYIRQLVSATRHFGSIAMTGISGRIDLGDLGGRRMAGPGLIPTRSAPNGGLAMHMAGDYGSEPLLTEADVMTKAQIQQMIDKTVESALQMKSLGFEMLSIHNAYRSGAGGTFWSPICNKRTDEYGGSARNRARVILETFDALRQSLGRDFALECMVSGYEDEGITIDDTIQLARWGKGLFNILHIRHGDQDPQHPTGYSTPESIPCPNLDVAAAIKQGVGNHMLIAVSAGLQDPDFNEKILADGKADIIAMCRAFICDSQYGKKIEENRAEDITPCIRCNKCHGPNVSDPIKVGCSVNPAIGMEHKLDQMVTKPDRRKKVGVIGGGPAGMEAALIAAKRGHSVTLFESSGALGGQLKHADYADFKWPIRKYKDHMAAQLSKAGVDIRLNTQAEPEMIKQFGFDDLIVAIGPSFPVPAIPGADRAMAAVEVFGNEARLPKRVVVVGGSETGVDTGLYLAKAGHQVYVTTRQDDLVNDAPHAHSRNMIRGAYYGMENFTKVVNVKKYVSIGETGLTYVDADGAEQKLQADMVVLATGAAPRPIDSAKFYGCAGKTHYVGDCVRVGDIHNAVSSAFGAAANI